MNPFVLKLLTQRWSDNFVRVPGYGKLPLRPVRSLCLFMGIAVATLTTPIAGRSETPILSPNSGIPFSYAEKQLVIPVRISDHDTKFILDTGAGVNLFSKKLAERFACKATGHFSGRRMSGQKLHMQMTKIPTMQVGSCTLTDQPAAIWDMDELFQNDHAFDGIEGIVSLNFFKNTPFTVDYKQKTIFIEDEASLKQRLKVGTCVPIAVDNSAQCQTGITIGLAIANGKHAQVEVDTGSDCLILNEPYMRSFKLNENSKELKKREGKDETGHAYNRYFGSLPCDISLAKAPLLRQEKPDVMFQKIIHDGLIGDSLLHNFVVTYDIAHKRMIFASYQAKS